MMKKAMSAGRQGFTLIETIVAISLLTVGVVGSFSLMQKVTSFTSVSRSQFVASYLAQEGIEIIRNIRDTNYLKKIAWDSDIGTAASYQLDYRSSVFPDATCGDYLKYSEVTHTYICSTDTGSKFRRQITIEKTPPNKMVVSVEVSWSEKGIVHKRVAQTELYNWR